MTYLFTSESVSEGHPDKVCDRISDSILDLFLAQDPCARVAVETLATTNRVVLAGELNSSAGIHKSQIEETARQAIHDIGYEQAGFDWRTVQIENYLHQQSADIAMGVDRMGAGDQGMMFGFATNECTDTNYMPTPICLAHRILENLAAARKSGRVKGLEPDAKSQVTLVYENGKPVRADSIVVSTQHHADLNADDVRELIRPLVIASLPKGFMCEENKFFVNPTGRFVTGGPDGDSGLTGRKIIVDTYGGAAPHGGGAFSGKDPTKVDRSAAYMARYVAKNIVAAGVADQCLIQVAYAIGIADPLSIYVNTEGTGKLPDEKIAEIIRQHIDFTPVGIRTQLGLNKPIYVPTSSYGHFGRTPTQDGHFSWEKLDLVEKIKGLV